MATLTAQPFSVGEFLAGEREKDLLRFSTAGSVDDGKSTLIGRLLYDTQSVYEDQVHSIEGKGTTAPGQIDFALLTDGLRAEREQGITIDVAYRYFATARRKFIIADTPGHEQYTRNMTTGASTADAAVVLIDASKGVLIQSRRHAYIASLLRVRNVIVAVNKMDLIGYDEAAFRAIEADFTSVLDQIAADTGNPVESIFVPVSALAGDNIVHRSDAMPWYSGPSLLELAGVAALLARHAHRALSISRAARPASRPHLSRFCRPDRLGNHRSRRQHYRASFGKIGGSRAHRHLRRRPCPGARAAFRHAGSGSRTRHQPRRPDRLNQRAGHRRQEPAAALVWMDQRPLVRNRRYLLKHTSQTVPAFISAIAHRTNIGTLAHEPADTLEMNGIGVVNIDLLRPIALDLYGENRSTGAFILIDAETNSTVAAGMITAAYRSCCVKLRPGDSRRESRALGSSRRRS